MKAEIKSLLRKVWVFLLLGVATAHADTFTVIHNFGDTNVVGTDGANPTGPLCVANGALYGTASSRGAYGVGMMFRVGTDGSGYTNLHSFGLAGFGYPASGLTMFSNVFYGETSEDAYKGSYPGGVFAINADGSGYTNLQAFPADSGIGSPLLAVNGTVFGVVYDDFPAIFSIGTNGHNFKETSMGADTSEPSLTSSGNILYGSRSGIDNGGIFTFDTNGPSFNFLFRFSTNYPVSGLCALLVTNDTIYGVCTYGGTFGQGAIFSLGTNGSNFALLHSFTADNGRLPFSSLTYVNGTLYGTTDRGGVADAGTIYSVNTDGTGFTFRHSFTGGADGAGPSALVLSGNTLYGTAAGGATGVGLIFAIPAQPIVSSTISNGNVVLSWIDPTYSLQSAPSPSGIYTNVSGATSPYTNSLSGPQQYYRLISN